MKFLRSHWYDIGGVVAIGAVLYLAIFWSQLDMLVRLMLISFIAMLVHQYEEYGFPGGEPAITNLVMQPSDLPDRYPLNQNSAMIGNVLLTYIVYLLPVFFPRVIWLGLAPIFMGFGQFIVHGVVTNRKLKSFYNPGLGAVVFLHIPIGICYIYYIISNGLATGMDWLVGVVYLVVLMAIVGRGVTYGILASRNSQYPFDKVEMERFHVAEKMAKLANK